MNPLHFSKTVDLKHSVKYTFIFFPLCSWKQPSQALDSRVAEDMVSVLFYSCPSLQPGITRVFAHGVFCLARATDEDIQGYVSLVYPACYWHVMPLTSIF